MNQGEIRDPYFEEQLATQVKYLSTNKKRTIRLRKVNRYFRSEVSRLILSQIVPGSNVIDFGCGDASTLVSTKARNMFAIDLDDSVLDIDTSSVEGNFVAICSPVEHVNMAELGLTFDYVILSGLLEHVYDILTVLQQAKKSSSPETRILVVTYSRLWQPLFRMAEKLGLKSSLPIQNWVPVSELENLGEQSGLEVVKKQKAILIPFFIPLLSRWINKWIAPLPLVRQLAFAHLTVLKPIQDPTELNSVSVVVAARNESGNIRGILERMPKLAERQEVIFVEGHSTDDTWDVIQKSTVEFQSIDYPFEIKAFQQEGKGKGDAIRKGFAEATGEALIILDADLSVPPEELPRFIDCLNSGSAEFVNGSRLVYGMDSGAMRFLNLLGNRFFGTLFTFLLGQPIRDTLCGTKALRRDRYLQITANRERFGDFDPFGDFDLLFGAAGLNLKIRDQPVHYKARSYGSTNISRFSHGYLLLQMSWIAARKIRFI